MSNLNITKQEFENLKKENKITLVDFYADWCNPCRMLAPIIEEIASERKDINVGKVNVDNESDLARELGIRNIPTMIIFKNGKEIQRLVGFYQKDAIVEYLK